MIAPNQQIDREQRWMQTNREELTQRIAQILPVDGKFAPIPGLVLHRVSAPTERVYGVTDPSFCVVAQGSKVVLLGSTTYRFDPAHYLLSTAELPFVSQVIEASPAQPYLSLGLTLNPTLVGSVMIEARQPASPTKGTISALDVSQLDANLLDAVVRLIRLLDAPNDAQVLIPLIMREIVYRLLQGVQSLRLQQIAVVGGATHRIVSVIEQIKREFNQSLRIEALAHGIGMSVSAFHQHFKAVTGMSPVQFQKHFRLQEARRLMLGENLDAASAGYRVGYADAAHFTRDYKRFFGTPPMRDMMTLRAAMTANVSL